MKTKRVGKRLPALVAFGGLLLAAVSLNYSARGLGVFANSDVILGLGITLGVGASLFALGVLVSAVGQALRAIVDTAVNTSPTLTDQEKQNVIGS